VPASVALSRHRPGRQSRYGACLGCGCEKERTHSAGLKSSRADPHLGRPCATCGSAHDEAGDSWKATTLCRFRQWFTASETARQRVAGPGSPKDTATRKTVPAGEEARSMPRAQRGSDPARYSTPGSPRRPASLVFVSSAMPPPPKARGDDAGCPDPIWPSASAAYRRAASKRKRDGSRRPVRGLPIGQGRSKPVAGAGPAVRAEARSAQDRLRSKRWRRRGAAPSCAAR
jgi:hypothetical protein